jgi:hypothetical protein
MRKTGYFGITLFSLALLVFGQACGSSPAPAPPWVGVVYYGEDTPVLGNTDWRIVGNPDWWSDNSDYRKVSFFTDGKYYSNDDILFPNGTWKREGNTVTMVSESGYYKYEGTYYPGSKKIAVKGYLSDVTTWDLMLESWVDRPASSGSSYSGSSSGTSSQQSTQKTYIVKVTSQTSMGEWTSTYYIEANSAQEAQILAEGKWRSTNFYNNKLLYSSVAGSY